MEQAEQVDEDVVSTIQEVKEIVFYLKDKDPSLDEETKARDDMINKVKFLISNKHLNDVQRRCVQFTLTKLYTWSPYHIDFVGLGDLPELIEELFNSISCFLPEDVELAQGLQEIKYFKNDGREVIEEENPVVITLENALEEIKKIPTLEEYNNNIIGFLNHKGECINFIRRDDIFWLLDIPFSEDDISSSMLNDDSMTNEAVSEFITLFFNEVDGMSQITRKLEITQHMKLILEFEHENGQLMTISEMISELQVATEEAEKYLELIDMNIKYEEFEIPLLKQKAATAYGKVLDPNLYEFINQLGYDFYTAKKVGRYLLDSGWINKFPRIYIKA